MELLLSWSLFMIKWALKVWQTTLKHVYKLNISKGKTSFWESLFWMIRLIWIKYSPLFII